MKTSKFQKSEKVALKIERKIKERKISARRHSTRADKMSSAEKWFYQEAVYTLAKLGGKPAIWQNRNCWREYADNL